MNSEIHLAGISGSLRKGSYNTALLNALYPLLPEDVSMDIVSIAGIPLYDADLDIPQAEKRPVIVQRLRDALSKADGVVIVSPEYNYSIPGGLKNAVDWASRGTDSPLLNKPVALMGATPGMWGTVRMQTAFLPVFVFLNMKPVLKPEVLVAQAATRFDANGNLTDEKTKEIIRQKLTALKDAILLQHETNNVL